MSIEGRQCAIQIRPAIPEATPALPVRTTAIEIEAMDEHTLGIPIGCDRESSEVIGDE